MRLPSYLLIPALAVAAGSTSFWMTTLPGNPHTFPSKGIQAHIQIPVDVERTLRRSCYDCHSYETKWPWYSRLPVVSGFLVRDIERGRKQLNFSDWDAKLAQGQDEAIGTLNGICEDLRAHSMPLSSYRFVHKGAAPTAKETDTICRWVQSVVR